MTLPVGTKLGPYEILAPLGAGGMGEVYRARDSKLERDVAIKVLPVSLAADPDALARFEREALAVAGLSHPNIRSIFDFGTDHGVSYAVMELLEGETLRHRLEYLPIPQKLAMDYALQFARGLSAAHQKGVVHRDLKPENLFVSRDGHLKILDFGLAKKVGPAAPGEETSAPTALGDTEPGTVIGTVGYMSPEQVRGQPVDHRSDIFSFGAILYELLSGKKAFQKHTAVDTMSAILKEAPPELITGSGGNISPALDHIVKHCLEKDRENRFQSARDVAFALSEQSSSSLVSGASGAQLAVAPAGKSKVLIAVAALVVLIAAGVFFMGRPHRGAGEAGVVQRVVVLPFENLGAPEDDYFTDGIADEIRGKLTSLRGLQVIARDSSTPYRKTTKTLKQIAEELNVSYLLTATVRWEKAGGTSRVHVTPELADVTRPDAPTSKWQQPFDAELADVFAVQSEIATKVAHALGAVLEVGEDERLFEKPTQNLAAYEAFLKGEAIRNRDFAETAGMRTALGFFEQAVALDPGFAQAWAGISATNSLLYSYSVPTPALAERARQAAEKAVALAPNRSDVYMALGYYEQFVSKDVTRALEHYEKGLRAAPRDAFLVKATADAEAALGRWDAAAEHFRQAVRLDPRNASNVWGLGEALLYLRRYPEAREAIDRGLALVAAHPRLIGCKAMTYLGEGDLAGARAVLKAVPREVAPTAVVAFLATYQNLVWVPDEEQRELLLRLTPSAFDDDRGFWALSLAQAYALKGDAANVRTHAEEARKVFEEQVRASPLSNNDGERQAGLGLALAYLGRKEEAIREGERGVALFPVSKDVLVDPYQQYELARIYILVGEPEKALDQLEPLLKIPYTLSPRWLAIDPTFDPLRKNPRFQKLVAGK